MNDEEVFEAARGLVEDQRDEFLANCDPEQVLRVKALLDADITPDSLLDTTAMHMETEETSQLAMPKRLGDFEILRELGRGGMGVVYEARQQSLKRTVALKVLGSGLGLSSKAILRFRREAEAAGKLHHTNIVPVYTTGEDRGIHFYAMELIDGPSLDQVIKERCRLELRSDESMAETADRCIDSQHYSVSIRTEAASQDLASQSAATISTSSGSSYLDEVATMIADVAEALDHAHEHGVIHRDIKPSNLLLGPDGRLSINDFGLARMLEQPGMTVSGEFVGSPLYMSPEQITAGRVAIDHRTDIYSLGATLYELLTGQPPFPGQSRDQVLSQILHKEPSSPRKLDRKVPVDLDTICMKAIDKDPDRRYQTAGQLADDLRKYVNRYAISARRVGVIAKSWKWIRRNPLATATVFLAACLLTMVMVDWRVSRQKAIDSVKEKFLMAFLAGSQGEVDSQIAYAKSLGAPENLTNYMEGAQLVLKGEYQSARAKLVLAQTEEDLTPFALLTLAYNWEGDEENHFSHYELLLPMQADTFFEKLAKGWALSRWNPREAIRLIEEARDERSHSQVALILLARAKRWLALKESDSNISLAIAEEGLKYLEGLHHQLEDKTLASAEQLSLLMVVKDRLRELGRTNDPKLQRKAKVLQLVAELERNLSSMDAQWALFDYYVREFGDQGMFDLHERLGTRQLEINNYFAVNTAAIFLGQDDVDNALAWENKTDASYERVGTFFQRFIELSVASAPEREEVRKSFVEEVNGDGGASVWLYSDFDWAVLRLLNDPLARTRGDKWRHFKKLLSDDVSEIESMALLMDGSLSAEELESRISSWGRVHQAHALFLLGIDYLATGERGEAKRVFRKVEDLNYQGLYVYWWSKAFARRLDDPKFYGWIDAMREELPAD